MDEAPLYFPFSIKNQFLINKPDPVHLSSHIPKKGGGDPTITLFYYNLAYFR